jgi:DNA-binding GntR family transcriptional regulator
MSLRDQAYEAIKERIITLDYRPGEYLNEARVCDDLGIGRTPVHQALDRLMLDGMVEVLPRKGVIVKPVSLDDVLNLVEVRMIHEPICARLAAERGSADELARIMEFVEESEELVASHDLKKLMVHDRAFHQAISRAARNPLLGEVISRVHDRILRFWFIALSDREQVRRVDNEHAAIGHAIAARDSDLAEATSRDHIESFRKRITTAI